MNELVRLNWGLIGSSGFSDAVFAPVLLQAEQELIGAAGSTPRGSAAFAVRHDASRSFESVSALLEDPDVQVVWVASPNHLHYSHVRQALLARCV